MPLIPQRKIRHWLCCLGVLLLVGAAWGQTNAPVPTAEELREEAQLRTIAQLLEDQSALLKVINEDPEGARLPHAEKERRVKELILRYERCLRDEPEDVDVLLFYGKFLRAVDARREANGQFEKADKILPHQAMVQDQLGVYAAEEGDFRKAWALLGRAVQLEPKTAVYHYHLGEFLATYREHLVREKILRGGECDWKMLRAFQRASELAPEEAGYLWRWGESFFDCASPDWERALAVWNRIAGKAGTPLEKEVTGLWRARVLVRLGRSAEAEKLLAASRTPQLENSRKRLREEMDAASVKKREAEEKSPTPALEVLL